MKKISIVLVVFAVIISCSTESQDLNTSTESQDLNTSTESSTSDSSSTKNIIWGEIATAPEVYAAPDVTQQHIDITIEWVNKGIELWGNHGPLELWIVGESKDGARALDDIWCDVRVEKVHHGIGNGIV